MSYYLLVYDQKKGRILELKEFGDGEHDVALKERFERELIERTNPNIEVVVLSAASEAALRRTHARYFETFRELTTGSS